VAKPDADDEGQYVQSSVAELILHFDSVADAFDRSRLIAVPKWLHGNSFTFIDGEATVAKMDPRSIPIK